MDRARAREVCNPGSSACFQLPERHLCTSSFHQKLEQTPLGVAFGSGTAKRHARAWAAVLIEIFCKIIPPSTGATVVV